jgi:hypothetical protein
MDVQDIPRIKDQLSRAIQGSKTKVTVNLTQMVLALLDDLSAFKATKETLKVSLADVVNPYWSLCDGSSKAPVSNRRNQREIKRISEQMEGRYWQRYEKDR